MTLQTRITALAQALGADIKSLVSALSGKQPTLISGTNIKTINGQSVLGTGNVAVPTVSLDGPTSVVVDGPSTYTITDFSSFSVYAVSATAGTIAISGDQITYTAPGTAQSVTIAVTRDGMESQFTVAVV